MMQCISSFPFQQNQWRILQHSPRGPNSWSDSVPPSWGKQVMVQWADRLCAVLHRWAMRRRGRVNPHCTSWNFMLVVEFQGKYRRSITFRVCLWWYFAGKCACKERKVKHVSDLCRMKQTYGKIINSERVCSAYIYYIWSSTVVQWLVVVCDTARHWTLSVFVIIPLD